MVLFVFVIIDPFYLLTSISRHGDPQEVLTLTGRTYIWPAVFEAALQRPFTGYGIGVTSIAIPELSHQIGYSPAHAHNLLLQAFFSVGFLGFILIFFSCVYNFFYRTDNKLSNAMMVYILITSLFEASFLSGVASISLIPFLYMIICKCK